MNRNLLRVAYRPREAAEVTGLSLRFLYDAIQEKDLPTIRVGRCWLMTEKTLREWLERKAVATVETRGRRVLIAYPCSSQTPDSIPPLRSTSSTEYNGGL
jgi:excisionase family DNA binding protein